MAEEETVVESQVAGGEAAAGGDFDGAPPEVGGGVDEGGQQSQPTDWAQQALPAGHWALEKGFKTWGDFDRSYRSSSDEARRLNETVNDYKRVLQAYGQKMQALQQAQQAPKAGAEYLPGFRDEATWKAACASNPADAMRQMVRAALKGDQELGQELVRPHLEPLQQEQRLSTLRAQSQELAHKYPEAKGGSPENEAAANWINQNQQLYTQLLQLEGANLPEVVFKLATYDLLRQRVTAIDTQQQQRRKVAATARPGTGNRAAPKNATWDDKISRLAAEFPGVPEEILQAAGEMGPVT